MNRRWVKVGAGIAGGVVSLPLLFMLFMTLYGFEITQISDDVTCLGTLDDPCKSIFDVKNPNNYVVDIYSKDQVKLDFSQEIKDYALFVQDKRCSATGSCRCELKDGSLIGFEDWRCVDFTEKTKPRADKVYNFRFDRYSTTRFMLVGLKNHPSDTVKWGIGINESYLDPVWYGVTEVRFRAYADINDSIFALEFASNGTANYTAYNSTKCGDLS